MNIETNQNEHVIDAMHRNDISYSSGWVKLPNGDVTQASAELVTEIEQDDKSGCGGPNRRCISVTI